MFLHIFLLRSFRKVYRSYTCLLNKHYSYFYVIKKKWSYKIITMWNLFYVCRFHRALSLKENVLLKHSLIEREWRVESNGANIFFSYFLEKKQRMSVVGSIFRRRILFYIQFVCILILIVHYLGFRTKTQIEVDSQYVIPTENFTCVKTKYLLHLVQTTICVFVRNPR